MSSAVVYLSSLSRMKHQDNDADVLLIFNAHGCGIKRNFAAVTRSIWMVPYWGDESVSFPISTWTSSLCA